MRRAKSSMPLRQPYSWQQLKQGERYCQALSAFFMPWANKRKGLSHAFLGNLSGEIIAPDTQNIHLQLSPDPAHFTHNPARVLLQADLHHLPLVENCVDNCWLINTLNFSPDPHQVLREVNRVLCDDGYLFLSLFNPCSTLVCKRHFQDQHRHDRTLPFRQFILWRVIDWLDLLGFEIIEQASLARLSLLSGNHLRVIVARKTVLSPTLNTEKVRFRQPLLQPSAALTSRQSASSHTST
ncbi:class I SAM-dependent methyltransferase [Pasteurellaceae bacterium HPA106]|uniref:methyltransferase domain-containing protein n=1 Tax=Spirabiliibacterium pneumoniae TaxID=221400 RepID=UPI001AADE88B|nr:methyltransferase domain-containing protein [Spirabiliibacterium pneumoniae]MBE2896137.1 class I SAM-dependent methyltransferase [Spirabiliibacterium pneumoniae]